jgi:spore coat polysaccharide biosynthesis protein SpsF
VPHAHKSRPSRNPSTRDRAVAFIVARLSSSRLTGKQLRLIGDRPMLQWIIDHLRTCKEIDAIVIATIAGKENEPLREFARDRGLPCFWYEGDVDHVTTRLRKAAEEFKADICVLVSGDCPLMHAPSIDHLIKEARQHPDADVIEAKEDDEGNLPALEGIGIARIRAWQRADNLSNRPELKEHQFPIIGQRPDLFKAHLCRLPNDIYNPYHHRLSVDTWADIEFMNALYDSLFVAKRQFSLPNVLDLLKKSPELLQINRHVHQMGVGEDRKSVLMVVDAGNGYGYGHVMRSRELALQIIERLGWPVTFAVDDEKARHMLKEVGIRTLKCPLDSNLDGSDLVGMASAFNLTLFDIYYQRKLGPGWRQAFSQNCKVVVLDHRGNWTEEADLVVIPGVTYDEPVQTQKEGHPRVVCGKQYVILRREIARLKDRHIKKDIDLLAYLYFPDQKEAVRNLTGKNGLKVHVVEAFGSDFPGLLARSRMFLSGFGYSFYEALALASYPITLPLSDSHKTDARKFYDRLGIPLGVLGSVEGIENSLNDLAQQENRFENLRIEDGTPRIVEEIASLLKNEQS